MSEEYTTLDDAILRRLVNAYAAMSKEEKEKWSRKEADSWIAEEKRQAMDSGQRLLEYNTEDVYTTIQALIDSEDPESESRR